MADDNLLELTLTEILHLWQPGSHDPPWTWADEAHDLMTRDRDITAGVMQRVVDEGINYGNAYGASICLGSDGRVWDGHHRIVVARALGLATLVVDVVPGGPTPNPICGKCWRSPTHWLHVRECVEATQEGATRPPSTEPVGVDR